MAAAKVTATYELLEGILQHLPIKDIIKAKAVSKHWQAVIEGSLPLKKALFLVCDARECLQLDEAILRAERESPRLVPTLAHRSFDVTPLFEKVNWGTFETNAERRWCYTWMPDFIARPRRTTCRLRLDVPRAVTSSHQSSVWRRMHLTRPSCTAMYVFINAGGRSGSLWEGAVVRDPGGITLGMIVDAVAKMQMPVAASGWEPKVQVRFGITDEAA